jgi:hypothetical protein
MKKIQSINVGLLAALVGSFASGTASAHDYASHEAITRAAASALHYWLEDGSTGHFCPNANDFPTDPAFRTYSQQATLALTNLRKLRTGLDPVASDTSRCNQTTATDGTVTGYYPEDNLDKIGQFRISDFRYVMASDYTKNCSLDALHGDRLKNESWRTLGSVLGIAAGNVDNRSNDTVLWIKPTNAFVWGAIKDGLSELGTVLGAVALAPFACLWSLFSSGSSCADAKKWSIKYNPIDYVAGLIPGIPIDFTGSDIGIDMNGIWHFEQTAQAGNILTFANNPSGMYYPFAGPSQVPGAVDLAIIAATSTTGVSLDAQASWGVRDFGQFDEAGRFGRPGKRIPWTRRSLPQSARSQSTAKRSMMVAAIPLQLSWATLCTRSKTPASHSMSPTPLHGGIVQ